MAGGGQWFDCTKWSKRASEANAITSPSGEDYNQVLRVYFTQYHLHLQVPSLLPPSLGAATACHARRAGEEMTRE